MTVPRHPATWPALLVAALWLGCALALTGCSPGSTHAPVAEPPSPPVVEPPSQPPPRPVVVSDVRVTVTLAGYPMRYVRVSLGEGLDAPTDAEGTAHFRALDAGAYAVSVDALPAGTLVPVPQPIIEVSRENRAFHVVLDASIADGIAALIGDSDSSLPVPWRSSSPLDHLALVPALHLGTANVAQPCTSAAPTGCPHDGPTQALDLPEDVALVIVRLGLNDLHYGVSPDDFRTGVATVLDVIASRGALAVLVAPQEEEAAEYHGPRRAYLEVLADLADERGALYVDPGISWAGDRGLFVVDSDGERGVHLGDDGMAAVAAAIDAALVERLTTGTLDLAPPEPVRPCDARFGERYQNGASHYGLLGLPCGDIHGDLEYLANLHVCGPIRLWGDWTWDDRTDASLYRPNGSVRESMVPQLDCALESAADLGVQLDLTLGDSFDSCEARAIALRDLAARTRGSDAVAYIDGWNEADSALTRDCARRIHDAVRAGDPERLLTISLSAGASGDPDTITEGYLEIRDLVDFAAPHFPRVSGWWERSVPLALALQDATDLKAELQEEARQSYQGQSWGLDAYVSVNEDACAAGLLGYIQHDDTGFEPWLGPMRDRLDSVTRQALETQGASGCP